MDSDDPRRRPVVLRTGGADSEPTRRPVRYLAWAGMSLLGLVAAAGLVAGGTAVWSAFDPGTPGNSPAPLWFPPPTTITPQQATPTPDDHGGDRTRTPSSTTTPSDDHRTTTTEPGDDKGGDRSGKSGSGKSSSDDKLGHN
ncbi:hypothetical protein [Kribbella sp. NPDC055071]